jgi:hypothetical protein
MALKNVAGLPEPRSVKTALTELRRAVRESLGRFQFGRAEAASALANLSSECVYCDEKATAWDLLVPLRSGGEVVLGNVVPACGRCRASKGEQVFDEWMLRGFSSPQTRGVTGINTRVRRLQTYMDHFGYRPQSLDERLGPEGLAALDIVRKRERALRMAIWRLAAERSVRQTQGVSVE